MQIGFLGILALIFITLKLIGYITWSWWLVLLPVYGGFALLLGLAVLAIVFTAVVALIAAAFQAGRSKRKF